MKSMSKILALLILFGTVAPLLQARGPKDQNTGPAQQEAYQKNLILANFKIGISEDTREVKVVRKNDDPEVYTKAYILKNPVAYEIRPYIRAAVVDAKRTFSSKTRVECLKYSDGTEALLVSAEDYRFLKTNFGMTLDEVIEKLDLPDLRSSSGQKFFCYFPRYWKASDLAETAKNMGMLAADDDRELLDGNEKSGVDDDLNAVLFYINPGNMKSMSELLTDYDKPIPEVNIKYTVYQVDVENDAKIGADFQAWRNGDGSDAFSLATRSRDGWNVKGSQGVAVGGPNRGSGTNATMGLSPRWNTRYLDFLRAKGVAKSVTSGNVAVRNNQTAVIDASTSTLYIKDGPQIAPTVLTATAMQTQKFTTSKTTVTGLYTFDIKDPSGSSVKLVGIGGGTLSDTSPVNATVSITKGMLNGTARFRLEVLSGSARFSNGSSTVDAAASVKLYAGTVNDKGEKVNSEVPITYADDMVVYHDKQRQTDAYAEKFSLSFSPSISQKATVLNFSLASNSTAVGYGDIGEPRMNRVSYNNRIHVPNSGAEFMIGGIEKETLEKTTAKVPWLGDLPGLGWLLGSEGTASRKYQMVTILEVKSVEPSTMITNVENDQISRIREAVVNPDRKGYEYGFDQFYFDAEKKEFEHAP